jgi:MSHA biogenesis protein MshO
MRPIRSSRADGVTLVEMVMVIAVTGIIAAVVAVFIQRPVEGYVDAARRAELTDIAATALRRITRDVRTALPNSVRVGGGGLFLEYIQTNGGGRYRAEVDSGGGGNPLDFTTADTSFDVLGPVPALTGAEHIVVYNLTADPLVTTGNAYLGDNRGTNASSAGSVVSFTAPPPGGPAAAFPFTSPGKRFHVVQYPVTYGCDLGTGRLTRYWDYDFDGTQNTPPPLGATGKSALIATNVTACSFVYATGGATGRTGVVALTLEIKQGTDTVRLFQQAHVSNVP